MVGCRRRSIHRGAGRPTIRAVKVALACLAAGVVLSNCSLWFAPDTREGRDGDPTRELLIVHGAAETLSSAELDEDGAIIGVDDDVLVLGNIPNAIAYGDTEDELLVTLSGENAVLVLDETTLSVLQRIDLGSGRNPMQSVALGAATVDGAGLVATTSFLAAAVDVHDRRNRVWRVSGGVETALPLALPTGVAPQALAVTAGAESGRVRMIVANTAFSASSPPAERYGEGTLSEYRMAIAGAVSGTPTLEIISERLVRFDGFDPTGLNPTALVDVASENEMLVVGSGVNLQSDGNGADDGRVIVVDRDTLAVRDIVEVGGSPGSGVLVAEGAGHRLYLAGPEGIRSVYRDPVSGWEEAARSEYDAVGGGGELTLIADIAVFASSVYASDFWESRIIRFNRETDGRLVVAETVPVSQGPVAIMVTAE